MDQMVTGIAPATMARSMSGSATGGEREREKGTGRIPCSPGARWRGQGGTGRSDGDELVLESRRPELKKMARFARFAVSRLACVDEEDSWLKAELLRATARSGTVGDGGECGGQCSGHLSRSPSSVHASTNANHQDEENDEAEMVDRVAELGKSSLAGDLRRWRRQ